MAILLFSHKIYAQAVSFNEYQVKAVFMYNLINFVIWPEKAFDDPDSPFTICTLGEDPFGTFLDNVVKGEKINGRTIVIDRIQNIQQLDICHILFISPALKEQIPGILETVKEKTVLTVSDFEGFEQIGGTVTLLRKGLHIQVSINLTSAKKAGVIISSKLLRFSKIVN